MLKVIKNITANNQKSYPERITKSPFYKEYYKI